MAKYYSQDCSLKDIVFELIGILKFCKKEQKISGRDYLNNKK